MDFQLVIFIDVKGELSQHLVFSVMSKLHASVVLVQLHVSLNILPRLKYRLQLHFYNVMPSC